MEKGHPADIKRQLLEFLLQFITDNRKGRFMEVVQQRTRHLTIVLEDIFQPHNASAVLRSADCFGIQDVHIIENENKFRLNPDIELGSAQWLTIRRYNQLEYNTQACFAYLKQSGYRIIATTPHEKSATPETLPLQHKTALIFGTELHGLSKQAMEMADGFIRIPMFGFTESLNISVSAGLMLHTLSGRLRTEQGKWQLPEHESLELLLQWAKASLGNAELLEKEFHARRGIRNQH